MPKTPDTQQGSSKSKPTWTDLGQITPVFLLFMVVGGIAYVGMSYGVDRVLPSLEETIVARIQKAAELTDKALSVAVALAGSFAAILIAQSALRHSRELHDIQETAAKDAEKAREAAHHASQQRQIRMDTDRWLDDRTAAWYRLTHAIEGLFATAETVHSNMVRRHLFGEASTSDTGRHLPALVAAGNAFLAAIHDVDRLEPALRLETLWLRDGGETLSLTEQLIDVARAPSEAPDRLGYAGVKRLVSSGIIDDLTIDGLEEGLKALFARELIHYYSELSRKLGADVAGSLAPELSRYQQLLEDAYELGEKRQSMIDDVRELRERLLDEGSSSKAFAEIEDYILSHGHDATEWDDEDAHNDHCSRLPDPDLRERMADLKADREALEAKFAVLQEIGFAKLEDSLREIVRRTERTLDDIDTRLAQARSEAGRRSELRHVYLSRRQGNLLGSSDAATVQDVALARIVGSIVQPDMFYMADPDAHGGGINIGLAFLLDMQRVMPADLGPILIDAADSAEGIDGAAAEERLERRSAPTLDVGIRAQRLFEKILLTPRDFFTESPEAATDAPELDLILGAEKRSNLGAFRNALAKEIDRKAEAASREAADRNAEAESDPIIF